MTALEAAAKTPLLADYVALHARWRPGRPAVICGDDSLSWAQFGERVADVAKGLRAAGLRAGDVAVVLMHNRLETLEILMGCVAAGVVVCPLALHVDDAALAAQLQDCQPQALFASDEQCARADRALVAGPLPRPLRISVGVVLEGWSVYPAWRDAPGESAPGAVRAQDLCTLIYSSGTTGRPKGIAHDQAGRLVFAEQVARALQVHGEAVTLCALSLASNASWCAFLPTLLAGGCVVVAPAFAAEEVLALIARHRVTHALLVPLQYRRLTETAGREAFDVSSLQRLISAGSRFAAEDKTALRAWAGCEILDVYGLTEGFATVLTDAEAHVHPLSAGRPLPGSDLLILDAADHPAALGVAGEIVCRSPLLMRGYFNRPDATTAAVWRDGAGDPWFRTGDIGRVDAEGLVYLVGRKKDMILSGGQNVYPEDLEAVALAHPDVAAVAVVGAPDPVWDETPVAFVVPRPSAAPDPAAIQAFMNARLGARQKVREVRLIDRLPVNAMGKVLRRELLDALAPEPDPKIAQGDRP